MKTFIEKGTRFQTVVGTTKNPEVVRWTNWGNGPIQQCFALHTTEGKVLVDPGRPVASSVSEMDNLFGDRVAAVICTTSLHERNIYWFRQRYGAKLFVPKVALEAFDGTPDHAYVEGDFLPGGVKAMKTMDGAGETVMHWSTSSGTRMLLCGDSIYGQSEFGGFDCLEHDEERFWMQEGGMRFRLEGRVDVKELKRQYAPFLELDFDLILNGHNPKPLNRSPKLWMERVLKEGFYEIYRNGSCTYLWANLA